MRSSTQSMRPAVRSRSARIRTRWQRRTRRSHITAGNALPAAHILDIFFVTPYLTLAMGGAYDYLKRTRMEDGTAATEQAVEGEF